jgi:hypothetical protein
VGAVAGADIRSRLGEAVAAGGGNIQSHVGDGGGGSDEGESLGSHPAQAGSGCGDGSGASSAKDPCRAAVGPRPSAAIIQGKRNYAGITEKRRNDKLVAEKRFLEAIARKQQERNKMWKNEEERNAAAAIIQARLRIYRQRKELGRIEMTTLTSKPKA